MVKEIIDNAIKNKQSVIVKSEEPLCDGNNTLSKLCSLYPKLTVINPIYSTHLDWVYKKLPHHNKPIIAIISTQLKRDILNSLCEYAFNQSVVFLINDDSPTFDAAFSNKCVGINKI